MPRLVLDVLGPLRITLDEKPVTALESVKVRALLVFLASEPDLPHARDKLTGLLWADHSQVRARGNLRRALWNLRQVFEPAIPSPDLRRPAEPAVPLLLVTRDTLQFNPAYPAQLDAAEFRALLAACQRHAHRTIETCRPCLERLVRAVDLYRGEFLQNFSVPDAPAFEEWLLLQREHFHRLVAGSTSQIVMHYEQRGATGYAEAEHYAHRHIELEVWSEEPYRALMRVYAAQNKIQEALVAYQTLAGVLRQELDLEPSAETTALYKHLRSGGGSLARREPVPVSNVPAQVVSLPLPPTALVGRATELAQLAERITQADCRLLTLVGQGGIGKTRLALETASLNRHAFPRGVYFVDLQEVTSSDMLPHAIAGALHLQGLGNRSITQQLTEYLQDLSHPLLLVLDNLEQLLAGAPAGARFIGELVAHAPHLTLLVTSRERVGLKGEWLFEVEGLRAPAALPVRVTDEWEAAEAVQLFVQCAGYQNIKPGGWNADEKRAVMHIAQMVEGMPLALELAAAWLRTLSPVEIADEIAHSLDLLTSTGRDAVPRHASIRAVFEHSWVLLTPTEQQAFARLSVFRGGFAREAAREIAGASLQTLAALVEKSLVKRAAGRFRLHELVRQFAAEKLAGEHETASTQAQHAHYFLERLTRRAPDLNASRAREALAELRREGENVRTAWQVAVRTRQTLWLEQSVHALASYYMAAGLIPEGETLLRETLAACDAQGEPYIGAASALASELYAHLASFTLSRAAYPETLDAARRALELGLATGTPASRVMGEWLLGSALQRHSRDPAAVTHLEHARALAQTAQLPVLEAEVLFTLAHLEHTRRDDSRAQELFTRALELADAHGEQRLAGKILIGMVELASHQDDLERAEALLERALPLKRRLGDPVGELNAYILLGTLAVCRCQFERAHAWHNQAVTLAAEIGDQRGWIHTLVNRAWGLMLAGAYEPAREIYLQALPRAQEHGDVWAICNALWGLGAIENAVGTPARVVEYGQTYLDFASGVGDEREIAYARLTLAYGREGQGDADAAASLYRQALLALTERHLRGDALSARAGLARLALVRGEKAEAQALASGLLDALSEKLPQIESDPLRLYLTCYQVLSACGDPRAAAVLETAYTILHRFAAAMQEDAVRKTFLENVPWHRAIERAYHR